MQFFNGEISFCKEVLLIEKYESIWKIIRIGAHFVPNIFKNRIPSWETIVSKIWIQATNCQKPLSEYYLISGIRLGT